MEEIISHSSEQTETIALNWAKGLQKGDVIALCGELGGGKTTFVRGLFLGLGGDPQVIVHSPTFTLLHEYQAIRYPLFHFDLYRLQSYTEFHELDFEDYLGNKGIAVIEWADKFPEMKTMFDYWVRFEILSGDQRKLTMEKLKP